MADQLDGRRPRPAPDAHHPPVDRRDEDPAISELGDKLLGQGHGHRRDEDPVEGRPVRGPEDARRSRLDPRPTHDPLRRAIRRPTPRGSEVGATEGDEIRLDLQPEHRAARPDEVREQRGRPPRPGADVEHAGARLRCGHIEQAQHLADRRGLRVRHAVDEREWPILAPAVTDLHRQEGRPRRRRKGLVEPLGRSHPRGRALRQWGNHSGHGPSMGHAGDSDQAVRGPPPTADARRARREYPRGHPCSPG